MDKPSGYKIFCEPETIHYKKLSKSVLKTITFNLEDDNNEEADFNQKTFTFTLQMIKIWTNIFTYFILIRVINELSKNWKNSYCVGGKHYSGTKKIAGGITINKKTGKENKILVGNCVICGRKKSMIVNDNTIKTEGLGSFFKNLGTISARAGKKLATNALKNPARFLEIGANVATAAASRNPKAALSTLPEVINLYHTGKGLYLGKFV